jgi:hypothetical protein
MAHLCILSCLGGTDQEDHESRPAQAKVTETPPFQPISQMWWYTPVVPAMWEAPGRSVTM